MNKLYIIIGCAALCAGLAEDLQYTATATTLCFAIVVTAIYATWQEL